MVKKFLGFLYRETNTINQAALLLGLFAFLSQILAFLRDRLLAHIFGAGVELDVYYAAFRIPDFIFVTVASVVSLSVLIPFIIEEESHGSESLQRFINDIFSFFSILIIVISGLAFFLMPTISRILFKGFSDATLIDVVFISRILLLSPIILGFSNLLGSLVQAYNRFTIYALAPLLYNAGIIIGILLFAERIGITGVAIGVIIGAGLHVLVQVPFVVKQGLFPQFSSRFSFALITRVIRISMPRTLTLSMSAISMIFLVSLASLMASGSISTLSFSFNLQSVPLSIIGVSYSLAVFPTLSRRFKENNLNAFREQMIVTARFIIFWSLPLSALFIVLRAQTVRVTLGSGLFGWDDTRLTAASLALFAISSMFQCLLLLFIRGFYSAGFTKIPFVINLISTFVLGVSAWSLVQIFYFSPEFSYFVGALLKVEDLSDTVVLMLPLSFSIATVINGVIHWAVFERIFSGFSRGIVRTFFECLGASVIMGAIAYAGLNIFAVLVDTTSLFGIFLQGFLSGVVSIGAGIIILFALKSRELYEIWRVIHSKFWKTEVIAADPEIV